MTRFADIDVEPLKKLSRVLRGACHAPGCADITRCPEMCVCNRLRKFKLNHTTAMCWELANATKIFLSHMAHMKDKRRTVPEHILSRYEVRAAAIDRMSYYHHTTGWQTFFGHASYIIDRATSYWSSVRGTYFYDNRLEAMQSAVNRLKRDKR